MFRKEAHQQALVMVKICWRHFEDVFGVTNFHLPRGLIDFLEDVKLLRFIMTKTKKPFCYLIRFYIIIRPKAPHIFP